MKAVGLACAANDLSIGALWTTWQWFRICCAMNESCWGISGHVMESLLETSELVWSSADTEEEPEISYKRRQYFGAVLSGREEDHSGGLGASEATDRGGWIGKSSDGLVCPSSVE